MDLGITGRLYVVTGATSGFGKAIADSLIAEGAKVIINARGEERLTGKSEAMRWQYRHLWIFSKYGSICI